MILLHALDDQTLRLEFACYDARPDPIRYTFSIRSQRARSAGVVFLADDPGDGVSERLLIFACKLTEAADDERLLDSSDDGLDRRGLDEACSLPVGEEHFSHCIRGPQLAGDRPDDEIASCAVVGGVADDDRGALLGAWSVKGNGTRSTSPKL